LIYSGKVTKYFEKYGKVEGVELPRRKGKKNCKGHGFVWFGSEHIAKFVTSINHTINGRKVSHHLETFRLKSKKL
jgi:RNA recognition motif-containing protein